MPEALEFLADHAKQPVPPVCVVYGGESFLKRLVLQELRNRIGGGQDADFSWRAVSGDTTELRDCLDELATVSLFGGGRRVVVVEQADDFVSQHRAALEAYVAHPVSTGVLILDVDTWPSTTRLYKAVAANGLPIACGPLKEAKLTGWLVSRASTAHAARLERPAAELLAERVGTELGLLDQELAKLAAGVGKGGTITVDTVNELVGGWRAKTAWDMIDAAAAGRADEALLQLDRLLLAGEQPIAILGQLAFTLRRLAAATRLVEQAESAGRQINLRQALEQAGVKPFVLAKSEQQLRQLGRRRAGRFFQWLLEADLDLKGNTRLPARAVLERLIAQISKQAADSDRATVVAR